MSGASWFFYGVSAGAGFLYVFSACEQLLAPRPRMIRRIFWVAGLLCVASSVAPVFAVFV